MSAHVDLFYLPLDTHGFDIDLERAIDLLDEHEHTRYMRYKNDHAQQCYLQARRIVKTELAKRIGCKPNELSFDYSDTEKPFLAKHTDLHFNISHSHTCIIVGISELPVGVDVEDIDRCEKLWHKADDFLNPFVAQQIAKVDGARAKAETFTEYWSLTESYIKLKGSALYREKDRVKAEYISNFNAGRRYVFERSRLTSFCLKENARISVAMEHRFPDIELIHWRTDERQEFLFLA